MKKGICLSLLFVFLFSLCACAPSVQPLQSKQEDTPRTNFEDNLKAVWFSYYEIGEIFGALNRQQAEQTAEEVFARLKQKQINTVFFHVRAFADAFYTSDYFPASEYAAKDIDLLSLVLKAAHKQGISLHAWVNPYRVALKKELSDLNSDSPALKLYQKNKENLIIGKDCIFFNPQSAAVQKLILNGIREIVENYEVDGIHFDDYFYPGTEVSMDKKGYASYKKSGGSLSLEDYRREQVSTLIAAVQIVCKQANKNILFGISPQCSVENNRDALFADVLHWVECGYLDYILPQIYFGFENESSPFKESVEQWISLTKGKPVSLFVGLALYKKGQTDFYASRDTQSDDSPYFEWVRDENIIDKQIDYLNKRGVKGYALFSYTDL